MPTVHTTDDPRQILHEADAFLRSDPVRHNLILSLLHTRAADPVPGRYWCVVEAGEIVGVMFQSPLTFFATVTPMPVAAAAVLAGSVVAAGIELPGVHGEAATVAAFTGNWSECSGRGAVPVEGQRLYEVDQVAEPRPARGIARRATAGDEEHLVVSFEAFGEEIGEPMPDAVDVVRRRLARELWVWDDDGPTAVAGMSAPVAGVVRVGPVYTPEQLRGCGYASGLVAVMSRAVRAEGDRCILYTDLANPTSNSIYRALGYRAVAEGIRYEFDEASDG